MLTRPSDGRAPAGDIYRFTGRDIAATVGEGFFHSEIVKFGISSFLTLAVEGKQRDTGSLESLCLIWYNHALSYFLICLAIRAEAELRPFMLEVTGHSQKDFVGRQSLFDGRIAAKVIIAQESFAVAHLYSDPFVRDIKQRQAGYVSILEMCGVESHCRY